MKTDATLDKSVSDEAVAKATKQNTAVAHAEAEAGAVQTTDKPAPTEIVIDPPPDPDDPKEPVVNPRDAKREAIAKKHQAAQGEQGTQPVIPNEAMGLPDEPSQAGGGTVKLKVNGEEQEVPAEKVLDAGIRSLQKESAADAKLEEAGKKMSELTAREQRIAQREQELKAAALEASSKPAPSAPADVPEPPDIDAEAIVDDLYSGDKDKAVKAVESLRVVTHTATETPQQIDPNEVANIVEARQEAKSTLNRFYGRYPDIKTDQNLQTIVDNESIKIRQEHPEYNQEELLMESGRVVTEKYGGRMIDETGFAEKAARKKQTDTVTGADVVRKPQPEEQPQSRKSVVENMRADRR